MGEPPGTAEGRGTVYWLDAARFALDDVTAPAVVLKRARYRPEAVILVAEAAAVLRSIRRRIDAATTSITGDQVDDDVTARWIPHMTVGYSTADQPADPVIASLRMSVPARELVVDALTLVVRWGPERDWNWEQIGAVQLAQAALHTEPPPGLSPPSIGSAQ